MSPTLAAFLPGHSSPGERVLSLSGMLVMIALGWLMSDNRRADPLAPGAVGHGPAARCSG